MKSSGMSMLQFFQSIDTDNSGIIDRDEFDAAIHSKELHHLQDQVLHAPLRARPSLARVVALEKAFSTAGEDFG
jgi:hypothetical protein